MKPFPVSLPPVHYRSARSVPIIEESTASTCRARASFHGRGYHYQVRVSLMDGHWNVETSTNNGDWPENDHSPIAFGEKIGLAVINWWWANQLDGLANVLPLEVAHARATWLARSAHKLLTEVGDDADRISALQILASTYSFRCSRAGGSPNVRAATWAASANYHLERDLPLDARARAVALLVELITGCAPVLGDKAASTAQTAA